MEIQVYNQIGKLIFDFEWDNSQVLRVGGLFDGTYEIMDIKIHYSEIVLYVTDPNLK